MIMKSTKKYVFTTPYHRDSRLISNPSYKTTHEVTYPYHDTGKYDHIKSKFKQQSPFIKNTRDRKYVPLYRSLRPHIPYTSRVRQYNGIK